MEGIEAAFAVFLARALATAAVVIGVTLVVGRLGPRTGGIVAGLPIVIGPGIFFVLRQEGPAFVALALPPVTHALTGAVLFAFTYAHLARRLGPAPCLVAAVLAWLAPILLSGLLPAGLAAALLLFALVLGLCLWIGGPAGLDERAPTTARSPRDLLLRGASAGLAVGLVGLVAARVGPGVAGALLAFPVALSVIAVTLHQRHGADSAARALVTVQLSMTSIAAFVVTLYHLLPLLPPTAAFWLAILAALVPTTALLLLPGRIGPARTPAPPE